MFFWLILLLHVCIPHLPKNIYVYNYANKTIFKHPRICKMYTANICANNYLITKYMHSFLIGKFDLEVIENKFLITFLYLHKMINSVKSL
jgi:hypothetical protein